MAAVEFYAVRGRESADADVGLVAFTDMARPGYTQAYRWVPRFEEWVLDRGLRRDFRSRPGDRVNAFEPVGREQVPGLMRRAPRALARWESESLGAESARLSSAQLQVPLDEQRSRPSTDPNMAETVRNAPPGTWVTVRRFPMGKAAAARTWASEVRRGAKARLAPLGPLEAKVERLDDELLVQLRRSLTSTAIVETAARIAAAAHAGQVDKASKPYIGHPRRVAARLQNQGAPAEAIAAGWLHDVLEDTKVTAQKLLEEGVPADTVAAVDALTKRADETAEGYAGRIRSTPLAVEVKQADLADNTDPQRLGSLDAATRARLQKKYRAMSALLLA